MTAKVWFLMLPSSFKYMSLPENWDSVQLTDTVLQFKYHQNTLTTKINGTYHAAPPLANITIAGASRHPKHVWLSIAGQVCDVGNVVVDYNSGVLRVSGLEEFTSKGVWEGDMKLKLRF